MLRLPSLAARTTRRRPRARPLIPTLRTTRGLSGAATAGGAVAAASLGAPAQFVIAAQAATGAPWWLAIGGSTVALRFGLLPLLFYQLRETRRLAALRPGLVAIRQECMSLSPLPHRAWTTASRMYRYCRGASVQPLALIVIPLLQIPILIYSVVCVRKMVLPSSPLAHEMRSGGPAALRDLTRADASWLLPTVSTCLLLANLQISIPATASPFWGFARNLWQVNTARYSKASAAPGWTLCSPRHGFCLFRADAMCSPGLPLTGSGRGLLPSLQPVAFY